MKFASGNQPLASDVGQLLKSIPELVVNIPGIGDLRPDVIEHVLKGGEIPGISRDVLDRVVKQYMERLYISAAKEIGHEVKGVTIEDHEQTYDKTKYLRPLTELPPHMVTSVMSGKSLPYLNMEQTQTVKVLLCYKGNSGNVADLFSPKTFLMMKLLPRGYNFSKLSPDVINSVLQGEMPDFRLLPEDLQQHFFKNVDQVIAAMGDQKNISIQEILDKLPHATSVDLPTFSPYDINKIDAELVGAGDDETGEKAALIVRRNRILTAAALGLVGAATMIVLVSFFFYTKRARDEAMAAALAADSI